MQFLYLYPLLSFFIVELVYSNNLQVLDFESKRDLNKYMKSISKDLGVKCSYCHDMNDKSQDTKNKIIAREMIKMQQTMNKKYFSQLGDSLIKMNQLVQISCWTCHRGHKKPELIYSSE